MTGPDDRGRRPPGEEDRGEDGDDGLSDFARSYRKAAPIMAASMQLVVSVAGLTILGWWGDQRLGHRVPWMTLLGIALGMTAGFVSFFKTVLGAKQGKK